MNGERRTLARVFPVFSIVFAVVYFECWGRNIALFTYYPLLHQFRLGSWPTPTDASGPPMLFWGWMGWAAIAGLAAAVVSLILPRSVTAAAGAMGSWLIWAVPVAMCGAVYYYSLHWFR